MDIWIIRDGEKIGPLHDYEIRRQIEAAELPATTFGWHEGLAAWKPLGEIDIFAREFQLATRDPLTPPAFVAGPSHALPPPLPVETFYIRRFCARWLDLTFYSGCWWLGMWAARQDISAAMMNPWTMFFHFLPWFFIETLLIHRYATTLGKWILGISVVNKDASRLELPAALHRAMRVLFTGIGFGWSFLSLFCQVLSLFTARRLGSALWDHLGGHQVRVTPLSPLRVSGALLLFAVACTLQMIVISPHFYEAQAKAFPTLPKPYNENPFWHLPVRSQSPKL